MTQASTCKKQPFNDSRALTIVSALLTAAALIAYALTGKNTFTPQLSAKVIALMGSCILFGALLSVFQLKMGKYALYLLSLLTWLELLLYQASYISNVLVGIDGNLFSGGFLLSAGCSLLGTVASLIAAIRQPMEWVSPFHRKAAGKEAHA